MNSCMRCGDRLQHNYLVTVFKEVKEKRERLVVCSKCKEAIGNKVEIKPVKQENNLGDVPKA